jgi:hypothetical protein
MSASVVWADAVRGTVVVRSTAASAPEITRLTGFL